MSIIRALTAVTMLTGISVSETRAQLNLPQLPLPWFDQFDPPQGGGGRSRQGPPTAADDDRRSSERRRQERLERAQSANDRRREENRRDEQEAQRRRQEYLERARIQDQQRQEQVRREREQEQIRRGAAAEARRQEEARQQQRSAEEEQRRQERARVAEQERLAAEVRMQEQQRQRAEAEQRAREAQDAAARERLEAKRKEATELGPEFAGASRTRWIRREQPDRMTNQTTVTVYSRQQSDNGVVAEIVGACVDTGLVHFTATFLPARGGEPISLSNLVWHEEKRHTTGRFVLNRDPLRQEIFESNEFVNRAIVLVLFADDASFQIPLLGTLTGEQMFLRIEGARADPAMRNVLRLTDPTGAGSQHVNLFSTTWAVKAEFATSGGQVVVEIPLWHEDLQDMLASCQ